jgi:L-asparaginase/beta-aspartyl-peptidase (threonine type)
LKSWGCGTVGAVVRDVDGRFAVATSTGGSMPALRGRVGDTPIIGSGFFAGPAGAVAVTGLGEHIVRTLLANTVYRWIESGLPLVDAIQHGLALFPEDVGVGIIAVSAHESGGASNRTMPWCEGG